MGIIARLIPIRGWLYLAAIIASILLFMWYRHSLIEQGRHEQISAVQRAIAQQQVIADQNAEVYQTQQTKTRIEYRTRVREVIKHVPINHSCDLPADTVGMLNSAIAGDSSSGQSGGSMRAPAISQ